MGGGADVLKYRFQWNFPILFSPHDSNTLYAGGNVLFRSNNEGQSWEIISRSRGTTSRNKALRVGRLRKTILASNTTARSLPRWNRLCRRV